MPDEKKEEKTVGKTEKPAIKVRLEGHIATALARQGQKVVVNAMPNSCNFRVHWYDGKPSGLDLHGRELESRFIAVHEAGENKFEISDRTLKAKTVFPSVTFEIPKIVRPKKEQPASEEKSIFGEPAAALPAAEKDE